MSVFGVSFSCELTSVKPATHVAGFMYTVA